MTVDVQSLHPTDFCGEIRDWWWSTVKENRKHLVVCHQFEWGRTRNGFLSQNRRRPAVTRSHARTRKHTGRLFFKLWVWVMNQKWKLTLIFFIYYLFSFGNGNLPLTIFCTWLLNVDMFFFFLKKILASILLFLV